MKELKGIALILFGILLVGMSVAVYDFWAGDYPLIPCYLGLIFGVAGLYSCFKK